MRGGFSPSGTCQQDASWYRQTGTCCCQHAVAFHTAALTERCTQRMGRRRIRYVPDSSWIQMLVLGLFLHAVMQLITAPGAIFTSVQPQTDEHLSSCVDCSERRNPATSGTQNSANTHVYRAPQPSPPCPIPGSTCCVVGTSSPWLTPVQPVHTPVPALSAPSPGPRWLKGRYTRLNS